MERKRRIGLVLTMVFLGLFAPTAAQQPFEGSVLIRGGTFVMGTDEAEIPALKARYGVGREGVFSNETPAHRVAVSDFRLDRFEVTNARFAAFLESNPNG